MYANIKRFPRKKKTNENKTSCIKSYYYITQRVPNTRSIYLDAYNVVCTEKNQIKK